LCNFLRPLIISCFVIPNTVIRTVFEMLIQSLKLMYMFVLH